MGPSLHCYISSFNAMDQAAQYFCKRRYYHIQQNFIGSNTDGSFTMAASNSFLSP